jgi:uncharacterized protein (DUF952 family)
VSRPALIYKICTPIERAALVENGLWEGSPDDLRDGFIHLSTASQVPGTLAKHFAGRGALVLLEVAVADLPAGALRWEPSRGGQLFPHLYGPLPLAVVGRVWELAAASGQTPAAPELGA